MTSALKFLGKFVLFASLFSSSLAMTPAFSDMDAPNLSPVVLNWIVRGLLIALIIFGLIFCFAGYRLLKIILFLSGFSTVFYVCYEFLSPRPDFTPFWLVLLSSIAGFLGGVILIALAILFFKVASFIFGFIVGVQFGFLSLASSPLLPLIHAKLSHDLFLVVVLASVGGLGLIVGIFAAKFSRTMLILLTSFGGAFLTVVGLDALLVHSSQSSFLRNIITSLQDFKPYELNWLVYLLAGSVLALTMLGAIVQFNKTAKDYHHKKGRINYDGYSPLLIQDYE